MNLLALATLLVDPQTALLAGTIVSLVMTRLIRQQPEVEGAAAVRWGALWGGGYTLSVTYMYFNASDWMFGYLVDTREFPLVPFWFVFFAACVFCGAAGAAATAHFIKCDRMAMAGLCVVGAMVTLAVVWVPHWNSYSHIGTLAQWKAGTAPLMPGEGNAPFGFNLATILAVGLSVPLLVHLIRKSLRA